MAGDEFSFIRRWTNRSWSQEGGGLSVGIGDDAAVFSVSPGMEVVACCDAMVEAVHFLRETMGLEDIGYKAVASNVSDVAAMGGIPRFALVSVGVAPGWTPDEVMSVYDGMYQACEAYGVRLIGGDTVAAPDALHLSVTLLGEVEQGRALRRSAARPGDVVFVTGTVGDSAAGLHVLLAARDGQAVDDSRWRRLVARHRRPDAQVEAGRLLITSGLGRALNDISDGLASEAWEIAEASGVSLVIRPDRIPLSSDVRAYAAEVGRDPLEWALYGGEDYQLVGTVAAGHADETARLFAGRGLPFILIGRVERGEPAVWLESETGVREPLAKGGYNHFRQRGE